MEIGDRVKVTNLKNTDYSIATLVGINEETASVKYDDIGGVFTFNRRFVSPIGGE